MSFKERLTLKTWYMFLVIIRFIIGVHVAYLYISFSSDKKESKGGTFIEATTSNTNYLPYTSNDDNDKFYQSLLFKGCLYPTIEGTSINYRNELCTVSTDNYQRFEVSVLPGNTWSDGTEITLNDIYFTYKTLIGDNYWNLSSLETFRNITVTAQPAEGTIIVTFPRPSIDNKIFFTNFILPAHILANQSYETYIESFLQDPTTSTCVELQNNITDSSNTVFNLTNCSSTLLKYYQVKSLDNQKQIDQYITDNPDTIDMVIAEGDYPGYEQNQVILNKFATLFLNTTNAKMTPNLRRNIASLIQHVFNEEIDEDSDFLVRDEFLFDAVAATGNTQWLTNESLSSNQPSDQGTGDQQVEENAPSILPEQIIWGGERPSEREFVLNEEIEDKRSIQFVFTDSFDAVSITHVNTEEYFPASYNPLAQSALYNLNPLYRNVAQGRNVYTIRGYNNDTVEATYTLIVYYMDESPTYPAAESTNSDQGWDPLEIIYYADQTSQTIVDILKEYFQENDLAGYFTFQSYADANTFEGKIVSQDYDIVIRSINMGLRKDLSNLFTSSIPTINPSLYTNQNFANAINRFFLASDGQKPAVKEEIDSIYRQDVPLIIVGKELGSIAIRESLDFPYPERLYVLGWRRDFIDQISIFQHVDINWDKVFQLDNFFAFIDQYL